MEKKLSDLGANQKSQLVNTLQAENQRNQFVNALQALDKKDLGNGFTVDVKISEYKPSVLKLLWKGHKNGVSIDISVRKAAKETPAHSIKLWSDGFDTGIKVLGQDQERIIKGSFPYQQNSDTARDIELTINVLEKDVERIAFVLGVMEKTSKPPTASPG